MTARGPRPAYQDLPFLEEGRDERHAWSYWGAGDPLGCLNDVTATARLAALASARLGRTVNIDLPLDLPDPPLFGRKRIQHVFFPPSGRNYIDDKVDDLYPQASTQWDGFRHLVIPGHGYFSGVEPHLEDDRDTLGIQHWARTGIVGRGILVDVSERLRAELEADPDAASAPVEADELSAAIGATGIGIRPGDLLCVRTGWAGWYLASDQTERDRQSKRFNWPGLSGSAEMAELLWDLGVSAVVADNPGVEAAPGRRGSGSLHRRALALLGMPFGELFDFEELSVALDERGGHDFLFVAVPLHLPGGVGSPGNAVAVI